MSVEVQAGSIRVWIPSQSGDPGELFTKVARVPVNVSNAWGIRPDGINIQFSYDETMISYDETMTPNVTVQPSAITRGLGFLSNTGTPGLVSIGFTGQADALRGEGNLFNVFLTLRPEAASGTCGSVELMRMRFYDAQANALNVDYSGTKFVCAGTGHILGDLTKDRIVDAGNAIKALRLAVKADATEDWQQEAGDMNGDQVIDSADAVMMLRQGVGLPVYPDEAAEKDAGWKSLPLAAQVKTAAELTVQVVSQRAEPGSEVQVPIELNEAVGLSGIDLTISYPVELELVSVESGTLTRSFRREENASATTSVRVSTSGSTALEGGSGALVILNLRVIPTAEDDAELSIRLNETKLKGQYGESFDWYTNTQRVDGHVKVGLCGTIVCTVVDAASEAPITDASVRLSPGSFNPVTDNVNGVYSIPCIQPNTYTVTVSAPGYVTERQTVNVRVGETATPEFLLSTGVEGEGEGEGQCCFGNYPAAAGPIGPGAHGGDMLVLALAAGTLAVAAPNRRKSPDWR
jgi:hypothetical protein